MSDVEKEIVELEKQYWQAILDRDVEKALQLTAEPCIVTGAQGVIPLDHATYRKMMEEESSWELLEFAIEGMHANAVTPEVVTTAYTVTENMVVDGKPMTLKAADASTWVRQGDRWLCALHTESILGDPFGRDRQPTAAAASANRSVAKKKSARKKTVASRRRKVRS